MTIILVANCFNYYMVCMQVKYFPGGDFETNNIYLYLSDIPASLLAGVLIYKISAKALFFSGFCLQVITGLAIVFMVNPSEPTWTLPALVCAARLGNVFTFTASLIIHPKMFPTLFATTSLGIANFAAISIALTAPIVAENDFPTPMLIFTISNMVAALVSLFLKEEK